MSDLTGKWALVTGASSGLGADFARILAERRCNLVLVARRRDKLEELQAEIEKAQGVSVRVITCDLGAPGATQALYDEVRQAGIPVEVLVNNAGYGVYGPFLEIPWERELQMLQLDIVALVHLTKLFTADMVARRSGYVLQIASIGAYQPSPTYASYAAAKAFVLNFGEAIAHELKDTGVKVTVLSPGVTRTEFLQVSGQKPTRYQRLMMMDSRPVAEIGIRAMLRGRPSIVSGFLNALTIWSLRFMPRRLMAAAANMTMQPS